jgi:hypothetical protein
LRWRLYNVQEGALGLYIIMSDIISEGEDALIVACEDDHYVVVAGTFEKLVEQLACEEKPGTPPTYLYM